MRKLPADVEELIMDYYWSHKMFEVKRRLHLELLVAFTMFDIRLWFWRTQFRLPLAF